MDALKSTSTHGLDAWLWGQRGANTVRTFKVDDYKASARSAPGQSRHFESAPRTSALPRSADIADRVRQAEKCHMRNKDRPEATSDCAGTG
jgi:hypothetical protein